MHLTMRCFPSLALSPADGHGLITAPPVQSGCQRGPTRLRGSSTGSGLRSPLTIWLSPAQLVPVMRVSASERKAGGSSRGRGAGRGRGDGRGLLDKISVIHNLGDAVIGWLGLELLGAGLAGAWSIGRGCLLMVGRGWLWLAHAGWPDWASWPWLGLIGVGGEDGFGNGNQT